MCFKIVDDSFVPQDKKHMPVPQPAPKPAPEPAPKGKHVQLFKMRRKVGKGFLLGACQSECKQLGGT